VFANFLNLCLGWNESQLGDDIMLENQDRRKILVMHSQTWEDMKSQMIEKAPRTEDPIGYLGMFNGIEVATDDELQVGVVEVYERWLYNAILETRESKGD
jgi:hypothetical protein